MVGFGRVDRLVRSAVAGHVFGKSCARSLLGVLLVSETKKKHTLNVIYKSVESFTRGERKKERDRFVGRQVFLCACACVS